MEYLHGLLDHTGQAHTRKETRGALPYTQNMHYAGTTTNTLLLRRLYVSSIRDRQHVCAHTETNPPKTVVILGKQELPKKEARSQPWDLPSGSC